MIKKLLLLLLALVIGQPAVVQALSVEQKRLIDSGAYYYNTDAACPTNTSAVVPGSGQSGSTDGAASIQKITPAPFSGPAINPTGVVLHWTAGSPNQSVNSFIAGMKSRGLTVQIYIDGSGNVYQLVDSLATLGSHAEGANSKTIGIEIAGGSDGTAATAEQELNSNFAQKTAVVQTVTHLIKTYNMTIDTDVANLSGILSHHQLSPDRKTDVGDKYVNDVIYAVKNGGQVVVGSSGPCNPVATNTSGGDPESNKQIGQQLAAARNFTGQEWLCLDDLWGGRESGWKQNAINDAEGNNDTNKNRMLDNSETISATEHDAYGIPQALPGGKMTSSGSDWRTNPTTQINWGLDYIAGRYQTPCRAIVWHNANGWY